MMKAPRYVPDELRELIEHSTREFEKILRGELGAFAAMVKTGQWVDRYRDEAERLALQAYEKGQAAK